MLKKLISLRSSATTADELVGDLIALIQENPKRLNMGDTVCTLQGQQVSYAERPEALPECGTVGCLAGWLVLLTGQRAFDNFRAQSGADINTAVALFPEELREELSELFYTFPNSTPGTKAYAAKVLRPLRRFRKTHRKLLQEHTL